VTPRAFDFGHNGRSHPLTQGSGSTRVAAMAAFAKSWRRQ
jgi:hypothetical protein